MLKTHPHLGFLPGTCMSSPAKANPAKRRFESPREALGRPSTFLFAGLKNWQHLTKSGLAAGSNGGDTSSSNDGQGGNKVAEPSMSDEVRGILDALDKYAPSTGAVYVGNSF